MPVTESSGTPSISIPLYEIHSGSLSLPLSLSYHASGVRVADVASWVGLGWSLNAGGVITRVVRGLPDEQPDGFREHYKEIPIYNNFHPADSVGFLNRDYYLLDRLATHQLDYQPDLYSFNLGGQAGNFMQGNDGVFRAFPFQAIHLDIADSAITLIDGQGTRYHFADLEYSSVQPRTQEQHISAWYLSSIISANQADTITFQYQKAPTSSHIYSINQQISIISKITTVYDGEDGGLSKIPQDNYNDHQISIANIWNKRLSRILFRGGMVTAIAQAGRLDGVGDEMLHSLHFLARNGYDTLKSVRLYHSYFNQDKAQWTNAGNYLRLKLDSVATTANSKGQPVPPYRFTYSPISLPDRVLGTRDYWGYTNGASTSFSSNGVPWLIPATKVLSLASRGSIVVGGGSRGPNPAFVQAGLLTTIRYPTGGSQEFVFEPNTIAESYRIRNPRMTQTVTVSTPPKGSDSLITVITRFQITKQVTRVICQLHSSNNQPLEGSIAPPKSTALFSLFDVTGGINVSLLNPGSNWQIPRNQSRLDKADSTVTLIPNHTYELRARAIGLASGTLTVSYEDPAMVFGTRTALVGGVRVREERLKATPQAPVTIRRYYYQYPNSTASSGILINSAAPLYTRTQIARVEGPGDPNCGGEVTFLCARKSIIDITSTIVSSNSLGELEGSDQIVSYYSVAVVDSASNGQHTGRTVSTYSYAGETATNEVPFPPKVLTSWKRGNLLEQFKYAVSPTGQQTLVSKLVNTYTTLDSLTFRGLAVAVSSPMAPNTVKTADYPVVPFAYATTRQTSGWQHITKTQSYNYAPGDTGTYQLSTVSYAYGNVVHCQPTLVETLLKDGRRQRIYMRFTADYKGALAIPARDKTVLALQELLQQHVVAQPVEQLTVLVSATDTLLTKASLSLGRKLAPKVVVPDRELRLRTAVPLAWHSFQRAHISTGYFSTDPHYETQVVFDQYDAQRQLSQAHLPSGTALTYLWDNQARHPVAKVTNATVRQVAVTSFEPGANGRWAYDTQVDIGQHLAEGKGRTGNWAYQLNNGWQVSRDSIPVGSYEVSCWYQGASAPLVLGPNSTTLGALLPIGAPIQGWQQGRLRLTLARLSEVRIACASTTASILLDDLVLQPVGAQLTNYTYDALRGLSSQTDPSGRTTFYEYDGLGRLVRTRDEQGRILSQQQYHYAGK
jgi:YD repeat-containing protein